MPSSSYALVKVVRNSVNLQLPLETSQQERKYRTTLTEISGEREQMSKKMGRCIGENVTGNGRERWGMGIVRMPEIAK